MSVTRTIKVPFLLPLTDENKRVWLGVSLFQLALCSSIDASDGGLSMRNSLYPSELARPARPALDARAFRPRLTQFNYFKLHLIGGLYTVTFAHCTGCTLCRLPDISDRHAAAGSKHACT